MSFVAVIGFMLVFGVTLSSCAVDRSPGQRGLPAEQEVSVSIPQTIDLAGTWEYEETSIVYLVTLDSKGNGTYDWQDGRMVTTTLSETRWLGTWHQAKNDREGGFELHLSHDQTSAQGRWWYTRIGEDHAPTQPGGTFRFTRLDAPHQAEFSQ